MDFLNKSLAQVGDLIRSMTPAARITAALLVVMIVVSLAFLVNSQVAGPDSYLFGGQNFAASEMPAMEAAFAKAGLGGYQLEGTRIRIPSGQQALYVASLADGNALPPNIAQVIEEPQRDSSPFLTDKQRQQRSITAKQRALSLIIGSMKDIESAVVMYDEQEGTHLRQEKQTTASVTVKPLAGSLDEERVPAIRVLVAKSFAGLKPDQVAVTDLNSGRVFTSDSGPDGSGGAGLGDQYSERKRRYEREWEEKIRSALHFIPSAVITTNVELDPKLHHLETSTNLDPKSVPVEIRESSTTLNSQNNNPGGRPGLVPQNGVNAPGAVSNTAASTGSKNEEEASESFQKMAVASNHTETRMHGLTPQRVTASIGVPSNYFEKIWFERNPAEPGAEPVKPTAVQLQAIETEESKKILDYVLQILPSPVTATADAAPLVRVTTFQHLAPTPILPPTMVENGLSWLAQHWSTLGMIVLAAIGLLMMRSMVRSARASSAAADDATPAAASADDEAEEEAASEVATARRRRRESGPTLRDELVEIVREDPDAAATILRSWIGSTN